MTKPSKYAPAPWSFDDTHFFIRDKDEKHVGQVFKIWLNDKDVDKERALANARLIAASPELLEVLKECVELLDEQTDQTKSWKVIKKAKAVIAKAKGETNE